MRTVPVAGGRTAGAIPRDMTLIRMNVRDFDEAFELLRARGFENVYGDGRVETESSRSAFLISLTGFGVHLIEHIRR